MQSFYSYQRLPYFNIVSKVLGHNMAFLYFKANCIFVWFKSLQVKILLLNENKSSKDRRSCVLATDGPLNFRVNRLSLISHNNTSTLKNTLKDM